MDKAVLGGNTIMVVVINIMGSIIVELGRLFGSDLIIRATMPLIIISYITENPSGCNVIINGNIKRRQLTLLAFGRQSRIEKTSLAFPSGSFGRNTPTASTSIWAEATHYYHHYKQCFHHSDYHYHFYCQQASRERNIIASYSTFSHFSFRLKAADARNILVDCPTQLKFSFAVFDDKAERTQQGNLLKIKDPVYGLKFCQIPFFIQPAS